MNETATETVVNTCSSGDVSQTVVMAVAEAKGVDPVELEPLYTSVDPDALNNVFRPTVGDSTSSMRFCFSVADCDVVVQGDGDVLVTPAAENDERTPAIASQGD
jgi:hypothetical protein